MVGRGNPICPRFFYGASILNVAPTVIVDRNGVVGGQGGLVTVGVGPGAVVHHVGVLFQAAVCG